MKLFKFILVLAIGFQFGCTNTSKSEIAKNDPARDLGWVQAEKRNTSDAYRAYLRWKPGAFREIAIQRIEEKKWILAESINSVESFDRYLSKYPDGLYSQRAKDLLSKASPTNHSDQKDQKAKKIDKWDYIVSLIDYAKTNINSEISAEAIIDVYEILEENFPPDSFVCSAFPCVLFESYFSKSLKANKPFIIAFAQKKQKNGYIEAIVQEIGGQEIVIEDVSLDWRGDPCYGNTWTQKKWDKIKIPAFGNTKIWMTYSIPCKSILFLAMKISYNNNEKITISTKVE
jgi:hypothetical protein